MRLFILAAAMALWAGAASAQERVNIPYAPPSPARFVVSAVFTTSAPGEQPETNRVQYLLEMQRSEGAERSYDATWTVASLEGDDTSLSDELETLLGVPFPMTLGEAGQPTGMRDAGRFNFRSETEARLRAQRLAMPLLLMGICHNVNLVIGEPVAADGQRGGPEMFSIWRMQRVLRSVEGGVARVVYTRSDALHSGSANGPLVHEISQQIQCDVDVETGVARKVTSESVTTSESGTLNIRFEITVTPQ